MRLYRTTKGYGSAVIQTIPELQPAEGRRGLSLSPFRVDGAGAAIRGPATDEARTRNGETARRARNVFVALVALVLVAPLMLLIAAAVRLSSKGPIIYRQTRVGVDRRSPRLPSGNWRRSRDLGGRPFTIYKFRTMYEDGGAPQVWATPEDPRVTPIGRILRKYRLDELPQLVNVIRGDMNIVGPRPEQPEIFAELREKVPGYHRRQRVLPGITGWAQVNQSYDTCVEDVRRKVELDLEYIQRSSPTEDFMIMAQTLPVLIGKKGGW